MHLLIDIADVEVGVVTAQRCREFLVEMPEAIGMTRIMDPRVEANHRYIIGFVVIAESHISVHFNRKNLSAFIDIFSCKTFDERTAVDITSKYFPGAKSCEKNSRMSTTILPRGLEYLEGKP